MNKREHLTSFGAWDIKDSKGNLYRCSDGPNGIREVIKEQNGYQIAKESDAYPTLSFLGNTFDEEIVEKIGYCLGQECREKGISLLLGPGVNIKRTPLCGRNFEYFSEDPYLSGRLGYSYIQGVQRHHVGCALKHFACNNREYDRFFQSSEVDERTLHEIYFRPFEIALKAHPYALMCSYNPVNGILASENSYLLKEVLRQEFSYQGLIISDWGAVRNRAISLKAGIDVAFPYNPSFSSQLEEGYRDGYLSDKEIDASLNRIDQFADQVNRNKPREKANQYQVMKEACLSGIVLLKNEEGILPLSPLEKNILLLGSILDQPILGGGGSSQITPKNEVKSLLNALTDIDQSHNYSYEQAYRMRYSLVTPFGFKIAREKAYSADVVILGVADTILEEKEETDRTSLSLDQAYLDLIDKVARINPNIVLVVQSGSAVDLSVVQSKVKAILQIGYAGERIYPALAEILLGKVSPSGRLAESYPLSLEDTYTKGKVGNSFRERYTDGVFVGYRYYCSEEIPVLYPFGYGLSYLNVCYLSLEVNDNYQVKVLIRNDSDRPGKEVVQLYIREVFPSVSRPIRELKAFKKVSILPHETKEVVFSLSKEDFRYYSVNLHRYYLEPGSYEIQIGRNANDIVLSKKINIQVAKWEGYSRY